jgi:hypothetical protein
LRIAEAIAEQPREEVAAIVLITALIVGYDPNENPLAGIGLQTARG